MPPTGAAVKFAKGHGTGNDFVIVPDPDGALDLPPELVAGLVMAARDGMLFQKVKLSASIPVRELTELLKRLLLDGLGPNALARFERGVLSQPGGTHLIVGPKLDPLALRLMNPGLVANAGGTPAVLPAPPRGHWSGGARRSRSPPWVRAVQRSPPASAPRW